MINDPIVEEVRALRREIEKEHGPSPEAYYEHLQRFQQQWRDRLVRRQPRPLPVIELAS